GKPDILKLGIVHPLPKKIITEFLRSHREVKILEELDDFVEQQVKALAYDLSIPVKIIGKVSSKNNW
ncbi:MAG: Indolepyruvate ferredoxin oxidoreductase, partial [Firmicutes bacterium]|nr:Indolepyruvate ferredoxin oxidoreductase [Bacillota bacterium]